MGKKLSERASLVVAPVRSTTSSDSAAQTETIAKPKTAIGAMAQFTDRQSAAIKEADQLREKLKEFDGSLPTKRLDPKNVVRSKWANRHENSFADAEFEGLKAEIKEANGNIQPIKVRAIPGEDGKYEIIFGQRRHQACLELGLPVLAMVEQVDDVGLFVEMDRENRQRKDLRPYEVGAMYAKALDMGLFPSARKLAEAVGMDLTQLGKALSLARLPGDVLKAFTDPLELQYRWASDLVASLQKDPERVLTAAKELQAANPRLAAAEVYARLCHADVADLGPKRNTKLVEGKDGQKGTLTFNSKKRSVRVDLENVDPARFDAFQAAIARFLA